MTDDGLPPIDLTPDEERFWRRIAQEHPGSNVADSIRLRDAIKDLNRLDKAVERVKWYMWALLAMTALNAVGTFRIAWSTDRLAHYAAEG